MPKNHPNRRHFEGVLSRLDLPSDAAPTGARGHRILLPTEVAREALDSLIGMPVGFGQCWGIHNYRQRCGIITEAEIVGDELRVCGNLFDIDYPEVVQMMEKGKLGMSFEIEEASIEDMHAEIWTATKVSFRGAALLMADKAAYRTTRVRLSAAAMAVFDQCDGEVGFHNAPNEISFGLDIFNVRFEVKP